MILTLTAYSTFVHRLTHLLHTEKVPLPISSFTSYSEAILDRLTLGGRFSYNIENKSALC